MWKAFGYLATGQYEEYIPSLYFYVGETVQNANLIDVGIIAKQLSDKLDKDHTNDTKPYLKTTYVSGTSGYRIWSDGYCEQWGVDSQKTYGANRIVTLIKTMKDTNYQVFLENKNTSNFDYGTQAHDFTVSSFKFDNRQSGVTQWRVFGYLTDGQY